MRSRSPGVDGMPRDGSLPVASAIESLSQPFSLSAYPLCFRGQQHPGQASVQIPQRTPSSEPPHQSEARCTSGRVGCRPQVPSRQERPLDDAERLAYIMLCRFRGGDPQQCRKTSRPVPVSDVMTSRVRTADPRSEGLQADLADARRASAAITFPSSTQRSAVGMISTRDLVRSRAQARRAAGLIRGSLRQARPRERS